jgi:hypothetical protein
LFRSSFSTMASQPLYKVAIDIPADVFREAKEAGPNDRGMYSLAASLWTNDRKTNDSQPSFTGQVQVKGKVDGAKGYASMWDNSGKASGGGKKAASDDLF